VPSSSRLRIAYFGLPLAALLLDGDGHDLVAAVMSPVFAPGQRRLRRRLGPRVLDANELGAELEAAVDAALRAEPPELLVSWFWTRKLPVRWLELAKLGGIGVHPSLLPRHRGPNPYFWAIDAGDSETGVTVHYLESEYDTGRMLDRERISPGLRNSWQLARALDRPSLAALRRVVARFAAGERPSGEAQDPALVSLAPEPTGALLRADLRWATARVLRRIRALSPAPGLALELGATRFFVTSAREATEFVAALEPGEAQISADRLVLRTSDGAITVERALLPAEEGDDGDATEVDGETLARTLASGSGAGARGSYKERGE
jgi:methionyl-tRNA formyltransferase